MTKDGPRTRTRSGCFRCRCRKKKCDGARPQCSYCLERGELCHYGVKASFHSSRQMTLSIEDSAALSELEKRREATPQVTTQFVDNTSHIVQSYQEGLDTTLEHVEADGESYIMPIIASRQPIVHVNHIASDHTSSQSTIPLGVISCTEAGVTTTTSPPNWPPDVLNFRSPNHGNDNGASYSASTSNSGPVLGTTPSFVAPTYFDVEIPVPELKQIQLIRAYLQETGTWFEATDVARHFTVCYVHRLMNNRPFVAAAMALAMRQLDAMRRSTSDITLSLYQHAVKSLLHYEPSQCGEATLVCCILLSLYEMMTSDVSEWRRHLKGCVFNLVNKGWNGSNPGLVGAAFWAFARIDVWAAYLLEGKTLVPPETWVSHETPYSGAIVGDADNYCNLTTLILAKIVNLLPGDFGNCRDEINALWGDLQAWQSHRPSQMLPILRTESSCSNPYPMTLHAGDPSICGNTMYHTGCILLLRTGQVQHRTDDKTQNAVWHARELCGISITNVSHTSWVNQVYPLYIAGRTFETTPDKEDGAEYAAEKIALLKHLAKIERESGWPTASQATALRRLWRLE